MSTRSQITVEGQVVKLYKHCDGYPSEVLNVLVPFIKAFMGNRGFDPSYMMARMAIAYGAAEEKRRQARLVDPLWAELWADSKWACEPEYIGFGLDTDWHGDIAYAYVITKTGDIEVFLVQPSSTVYLNDNAKLSNSSMDLPVRHLATIPLGTPVATALKLCSEEE